LDAAFFASLEQQGEQLLELDPALYPKVVRRCCELKAEVVVADQFESGQRAILNYGHTFGHALETLTDYETYTHGEAIAVGMMMAAELAERLNRTPDLAELVRRQEALFGALGLPLRVEGLAPDSVLAAMQTDKKFVGGENRLILPVRLGEVNICRGVDTTAIAEAIGGRCDA
jgi:3-dehydroquinate synthase